jgi:hypothetical protein
MPKNVIPSLRRGPVPGVRQAPISEGTQPWRAEAAVLFAPFVHAPFPVLV